MSGIPAYDLYQDQAADILRIYDGYSGKAIGKFTTLFGL
jgi:hypothetical protein